MTVAWPFIFRNTTQHKSVDDKIDNTAQIAIELQRRRQRVLLRGATRRHAAAVHWDLHLKDVELPFVLHCVTQGPDTQHTRISATGRRHAS